MQKAYSIHVWCKKIMIFRGRNKDFGMCGQMAVQNQFCMDIFSNSVLTLYHCVQQFALTLLGIRTVYIGKAAMWLHVIVARLNWGT